jgi:hypothetical protein
MRPHIKQARKEGAVGKDWEIAEALLDDNPVLRDRITGQVLEDLIDYNALSPFEKQRVRGFIPFYGWFRGITGWTIRLGIDSPEKLWLLVQASRQQSPEDKQWIQTTPDYIGSSLRIGKEKDGLQRVITTQGLNPFQTLSEIAEIGSFAMSGDGRGIAGSETTLGSTFNPYLKAGIQAIFNDGKDFNTFQPMGTPWSAMTPEGNKEPVPGGLPGKIALGSLASFPIPMLLRRGKTDAYNQEKYGTPGTPSSIYNSPLWMYYASYM